MKKGEPLDPLADSLRREAMAERPQFSPQLHQRILRQIHDQHLAADEESAITAPRSFGRGRWLAAGAAAAIIMGFLAISPWLMRAHPTMPGGSKTTVQTIPQPPIQPQSTTSSLAAAERPLNLGGILYARLLPPGVTVCLPESITGAPSAPERVAAQPANPTAPPGSPEWLLAAIEEPAQRAATAASADVIPPEARLLIELAQSP
jgi:hypothetical protein